METIQINLNDYFNFLSDDDIRLKGTRIGIETILNDYLNAMSPEEIAIRYPVLSLEQVYATLTYYLHNKEEIDKYMKQWQEYAETSWKEQQNNPLSAISRLQKLKLERQSQLKVS